MRIDAHQHFWRFDPVRDTWIDPTTMASIRRDFMPEDLAPLLAQHNINGCIAVQADQSEAETDFLLALAQEHSFIKGVVGWIDLQGQDLLQRLDHYQEKPLLKGFRHILQTLPPEFMLQERFLAGVKAIGQRGYTYDILVYPHQLPAVLEFVERLQGQKLVIDHLAKPYIKTGQLKPWEEHIRAIATFDHVYCKISGMVTEANWQIWKTDDFIPYLDVVFDAFGTDRLMYGSDWPVCLLAASYARQYALVAGYVAQHVPQEADKIFGQNAIRFYNLSTEVSTNAQ
ncbi:MAG: amidohydrolase family protein [Cytophagales bacterium]|nr:amidohydrolase family protein [Bernardetiaceae bacterium]MDW8211799.1 amidohydrolase family protein [Cytophagales bacterium]